MKKFSFIFAILFLLVSCKKEAVDGTDAKTFQSSINDMTSNLPTIKQIKFNEALYVLKTFGVEAESDADRMKALGKLLNGKKVDEIFALADETAKKNEVEWRSTDPPSLGEMNIFDDETAKETDPNDVNANALEIIVKSGISDSLIGVKEIQIIPKLTDDSGNPMVFSGATLEAVLEVFSGGEKLLTSKNIMQDSNFRGFNLKFASLPAEKITDDKIDITISVKTTKKNHKMSKIGIAVNPKALSVSTETENLENPENPPTENNPKSTVSKFLNHLNAQNLRAAYNSSANPSWGSYDNFANPTSGFGGVKNLNVKNISTKNASENSATVDAVYDVTNKNGETVSLSVSFGLKNINGEWKISSYKVN
ncbi:MAG: hypothetical protein LBE36_00125 [Flavobacteriaceae bacterium]|jgi:ribosomal protein L12E/L44/L45/RPP1/RPP2|nr:hypothetical protein [Flavobacteriaceae bacterium]